MTKRWSLVATIMVLAMIMSLCLVACGDDPAPTPAPEDGGTPPPPPAGPVYTTIAELKEYASRTAFDILNDRVAVYFATIGSKPEGFNAENMKWNLETLGNTIKSATGVYAVSKYEYITYSVTVNKSVKDFLAIPKGDMTLSMSQGGTKANATKVDPYETIAKAWCEHKGFTDPIVSVAAKSSKSDDTKTIYSIHIVLTDRDYRAQISVDTADVTAAVERINAGTQTVEREDTKVFGDVYLDSTAKDKVKA